VNELAMKFGSLRCRREGSLDGEGRLEQSRRGLEGRCQDEPAPELLPPLGL